MAKASWSMVCDRLVVLWDHQKAGVEWMRRREREGKRGGIVADEMGLGKTILGIARIVDGRPTSVDRAHRWAQATLIICPVSLIGQWESEVKKFANGVNVVKHHGPSRSSDPLTLRDAHVIITSYATVASEYAAVCTDSGSRRSALFRVKWWRIILDEAHLIRNWAAKSTEACFNVVGKYRWCFTGTPIQNRVEDLYSMFKFLNVKPLGDLQEFKNYIVKPIKGGQMTLAIERLQVRRRPIDDGVVDEDLSASSSSDSLGGLSQYIDDLKAELDDLLTRLYLEPDDENDKTEVFQRTKPAKSSWSSMLILQGEGKLIIFSHFTSMLDLVQQFLNAKGFILARYDGSMSPSEREQELAAGGIGLNFTACNNVILLEPWWNPAVEEQAFDCMHRIGQLLPVNIYKLVVQDTVEERMLELQNKKWTIADTTLGGNTTSDVTLDIEDVRCLFQVAE
ncbi:SNF2 family N-terminal domain-containing protein [Pisolithus croceorrhizus]|nr:SNF2 family N-terminal domain-containing protein [Pisolithus croceorrhizus]